jgi:hypothetical protein
LDSSFRDGLGVNLKICQDGFASSSASSPSDWTGGQGSPSFHASPPSSNTTSNPLLLVLTLPSITLNDYNAFFKMGWGPKHKFLHFFEKTQKSKKKQKIQLLLIKGASLSL